MIDSYLKTLCGCDCVTPFDHSSKPKCVFCDENEIDWIHILFQCEKCNGNREKLVVKLKQNCEKNEFKPEDQDRVKLLSEKITSLWETKDLKTLFYLFMAVNLHIFDLEYMSVVSVIVKTITPVLYQIQRDWDSID